MSSTKPEPETSREGSNAGESQAKHESSNIFPESELDKKCGASETKARGKCRKVLVGIREKLFLMKESVENRWVQLQHRCAPDRKSTKIYQIWPGKNVLLFSYSDFNFLENQFQ